MRRVEIEEGVLEDLEAFGLTSLEAKTYVTLLTFGEATISMLARSMGLHAAQLYGTLEKLVQKGFVIEQPGRPKVYRAVPPRSALNRVIRDLIERKKRLVSVLSDLLRHQSKLTTPPIWLVKGDRNILETMQELIEGAKTDVLLSIRHQLLPGVLQSLKSAREKGVEVFILLSPRDVPANVLKNATEAGRVRLGRHGDLVLITDMSKCLYIQHAMLSSAGLRNYALLTEEPSLVDLFMHNFERQWSIAKPINDYPDPKKPHTYTCHRLALADIKALLQQGYEVYAEVEGIKPKTREKCRVEGRVLEVTMDQEEGIYNFLLETKEGAKLRVGGFDAYIEDVAAYVIKIRAKKA